MKISGFLSGLSAGLLLVLPVRGMAYSTKTPTETNTPTNTPNATQTLAATETEGASTQTAVVAATKTAVAVATNTAVAATQTEGVDTQTAVAATETEGASTQTAVAAKTQTVAATQTSGVESYTRTVTPTITPTPSLTEPGGGYPTATPTPSPTSSPLPTVYSGLPSAMAPYGLEYVPFPTVTTSSNTFYPLYITFSASGATSNSNSNGAWGAPVNTARWHIVFQGLSATVGAASGANPNDLTIAVETRIGFYGQTCNTGVYDASAYASATSLVLPTRPQNNSTAYFWIGNSYTVVPYTERFDAVGDPRFVPYADELDYTGGSGAQKAIDDNLQGGYNWFWRNFSDGSGSYLDGAQDTFYKAFIPSAQWDHYAGQQNIDVPKLFGLIRQGVMLSNGIYTAMTGWDSYYAGQGGEVGGDNSNDFGVASGDGGVPCFGGPWGSSSTPYYVDEIIGATGASDNGASYVVTGTSSSNISWTSLPFVGELWPDGLYQSNWEGWNTTGSPDPVQSTTWGNLANIEESGVAYRVSMQNIPGASPASYYEQTLHRNNGNGCATLQNGTEDGNSSFDHYSTTETPMWDNDGQQIGGEFNFTLPSSFYVTRPWNMTLNDNNPQEWNQNADPLYDYKDNRNHLDVYSCATYTANAQTAPDGWGYYSDSAAPSSATDKSAAAIRNIDLNNALSSDSVSGNPAGGWFVINGLAPSTQSGINFVGQFALLTCLRTFADAGVPTRSASATNPSFTNPENTFSQTGQADGQTYRIPPVPLVTIAHPNPSDVELGKTTVDILWDERYARWDGNQYDENYPCVDANVGPCTSANLVPNPALEWHDTQPIAFNIIYNEPSVSTTAWYSVLTGTEVPAAYANNFVKGTAGVYMSGADAILPGSSYETSPSQYSYPWTGVAPALYYLEVEVFRLSPTGVAYPHYGYHKISINTTP